MNAQIKGNESDVFQEKERYLEFSLGHEKFAIALLEVKEVISCPETTPIPRAPTHFVGVMNLRGQVISIVDLRKKLSIKPKTQLEEAVIILELEGVNIGVIVDSINKVIPMEKKNINLVPEIESEINSKYIKGIYRQENSLTVLLDVYKVLDVKDLRAIDQNKAA